MYNVWAAHPHSHTHTYREGEKSCERARDKVKRNTIDYGNGFGGPVYAVCIHTYSSYVRWCFSFRWMLPPPPPLLPSPFMLHHYLELLLLLLLVLLLAPFLTQHSMWYLYYIAVYIKCKSQRQHHKQCMYQMKHKNIKSLPSSCWYVAMAMCVWACVVCVYVVQRNRKGNKKPIHPPKWCNIYILNIWIYESQHNQSQLQSHRQQPPKCFHDDCCNNFFRGFVMHESFQMIIQKEFGVPWFIRWLLLEIFR